MLDWKNQCAAVIPCFNEAARIAAVVADVRRRLPNVIVVDDGSSDATRQQAELAGADVIRHPANCGKGFALRTGWRHARQRGFTWMLALDGDGQHSPADIPSFLDCAEKTGAPLIVGNRMEKPVAMPWLRRQVNRWMSRRISRLTGRTLPDSQCGFRLAHLDTLLELTLASNRFEIESEMLAAIIAAGNNVEFVPIQVIYENNASRIHPLIDTLRWLHWRFIQRKPPATSSLNHA